MRTMPLLLAGLLSAALLAGCSGNSDPSNTNTDTSTSDGSGTTSGGATGTPDASGMKWTEESLAGSFEAVPLGSSAAAGGIVPLSVPDNSTAVYFNITITPTVPGGTLATEFQLDYHDADHSGSTDAPQATSTTVNGVASILVDDPMTGDWTMSIFSKGAPNQGSFTLKVNSHVPA